MLRLLEFLGLAYDAIFLRDLHAVIAYWDAGAEALYGWRAEEACGRVSHALLQTEFPSLRRPLDALIAQDGRWEGELVHRRRDGTRVVVECRQVLLHAAAGQPVAILETNRDITQRKQAETLRAELAAIVASSDDAIIGKTLDATITSWNRGAEQLFGYRAEEMVGRSIAVLYPPDRTDELPTILARLHRGERIDHFATERLARDGRRLAVPVTISPIRDDAGVIVGASDIMRDITALKQEEARARFLTKASALLAGSLDYEETLARVARLAVPDLADWAAVDIFDAGVTSQQAASGGHRASPVSPLSPVSPRRAFLAVTPRSTGSRFRLDSLRVVLSGR